MSKDAKETMAMVVVMILIMLAILARFWFAINVTVDGKRCDETVIKLTSTEYKGCE